MARNTLYVMHAAVGNHEDVLRPYVEKIAGAVGPRLCVETFTIPKGSLMLADKCLYSDITDFKGDYNDMRRRMGGAAGLVVVNEAHHEHRSDGDGMRCAVGGAATWLLAAANRGFVTHDMPVCRGQGTNEEPYGFYLERLRENEVKPLEENYRRLASLL